MTFPHQVIASKNISIDRYTVIPAFQIDLKEGSIISPVADRVVSRPIDDCSAGDMFCLSSSELKIIWRRNCGPQGEVGDILAFNKINARIVGYYNRKIHHSGIFVQDYILSSDEREIIYYVVDDNARVRSFLVDKSQNRNLGNFFQKNINFNITDLDRPELDDVVFSDILSDSYLGSCENTKAH